MKLDYHHNSRDYYGRVLATAKDLKTSACCENEAPPAWLRPLYGRLNGEIIERSYGCGSPIPACLEGCTVVDLGCGTGRDVYLASQLVGPEGFVIGVDFTEEQLEVARRNLDPQMERFGYGRANVDFREGGLEDLAALGIADESVDVVLSNCVLNLCPDKRVVLDEVFRVLKPGGEFYFADVFASRRLPADLADDPDFHGECLGGAWYWEDFRRMLAARGCPDYRIVSRRVLGLDDPRMAAMAEGIVFESATIRCFRSPGSRGPLRGLRPGGPVPGHDRDPPAGIPPGSGPPLRGRKTGTGLRKHGGHGRRHAIRAALRGNGRSVTAFRIVPVCAGRDHG